VTLFFCVCATSYFLIHFECPSTPLRTVMAELKLDQDIIRPKMLRAEKMISRPCEHRACDFGELTEEKRRRLFADLRQFVQQL